MRALTGASVLLYALGVVIFLGAIFVSIALHELGHLYYAKKFGCRVSQYMIGFGPTIWSWRPVRMIAGGGEAQSETEYGIKLIPLGGYVKIIGMFPPATKEQIDIAAGHVVPLAASNAATKAQADIAAGHVVPLVAASAEIARTEVSAPAAPAQQQEASSLIAEPAEATEQAPLKLRRSNTGLFAQLVSRTRAAEFELVRPEDRARLFYKLPVLKKILVMLLCGRQVDHLVACPYSYADPARPGHEPSFAFHPEVCAPVTFSWQGPKTGD